jgi:L-ascorbate metabolism protein UlaG (beta-lactamase superfamily)
VPAATPGEAVITFIGHSTCLLRYARGRVLTDPMFGNSLYGMHRHREAMLPPGALEGIDVALISHAHSDHLHRRSLERLDRSVTLVVPAGTGGADDLGFRRIVELRPGSTFETSTMQITAVPARHRVGVRGRKLALGYIIKGDGPTIYFAGDTGYFHGFQQIGERYEPEVALLPISGYLPLALRADHLSPLDALYAFEDLGARLLVPIHHSAFPISYEPIAEPLVWLHSLASARQLTDFIAWLDAGESCIARVPERIP